MSFESERPRNSFRNRKRKNYGDEIEIEKRTHRSCEKRGCGESQPFCYLQSSDNCCRDGYTSRWYHMSLGEHFCNECFDHFYRPHKAGFSKYDKWYHTWYHTSKVRPSIKRFVADEVMPYWLKCTLPSCGKWREVRNCSISSEYIKNFNCSILYGDLQKNPCIIEEEPCVGDISNPGWIEKLSEHPLLRESVAAPYLKQFREESIGLSPIQSSTSYQMPKYIEPFSEYLNGEAPIWPLPDEMGKEERKFLSKSLPWVSAFLSIRNLIVAVWHMSPHEPLSIETLNMYVICRGLVRIYLLSLAGRIIDYLTKRGVINYGIVSPLDSTVSAPNETVVIVGCGLSGLAAAKHLNNLGVKTLVLEASSKIGGRLSTDLEIRFGSLWINGLTNNPLTVLCHQAGVSIDEIPSYPVFILPNGKIASRDVTDRMILQFTGMIHGALETAGQASNDENWFDTITKHQAEFHQLAKFTAEEDCIFDFLIKLTEAESRMNFKDVTLKNYEFPKKLGNDGLIVNGFSQLLSKLADGLDIRLNTSVKKVSYHKDNLKLFTSDGSFNASRVIITVPLPVLQKKVIVFDPPLPSDKIECLEKLRNVMQENVVLQFKTKFWKTVLKDGNLKLGLLTTEDCLFQYFIDVTNFTDNKQPTLLTFVNNSNSDQLKGKSEKEIVNACYEILKCSFKKLKINVPKPTSSSVSAWCKSSTCGSSGSFVEAGSDYSLYDQLSQPVEQRIFFAGESTYRKCPNSMTGAYLSGLREAVNIIDTICPFKPCEFSIW